MSWMIFTMTITLLEFLTNELFLEIFLYERRKGTIAGKVLRIAAAAVVLRVWVLVSGELFHLKLAGSILLIGFYAILFFKATWIQGLCFSVFIMSIAFGVEAVVLFGCIPLLPEAVQRQAFLPAELFTKAVILMLAAAARHIWLKDNEQRRIPKNLFILLVFDATLFILNVFCVDQMQKKLALSGILIPVIIGVFILNICSFFYFTVIAHRENTLQELDKLNQKREMELAIYRSKREWGERQARKTHDYKNQLQVISRMLKTDSVEAVQAYIGELTGGLIKEMDYINTNHSVINAVLNIKYKEAKEKGITLNVQCNDLSGVSLEESDLAVLLGNLLDNAIEACECEEGNQYIQFKMILEERQLIISTKNRSRNSLSMEGRRFVSTKRNSGEHGIGTANIEAVAKKYGGIYVLRKEGKYVRAVVTI